MKLKKQATKKLTINKQTVANLANVDMGKVVGGTDSNLSGITCFRCDSNLSCIYCISCHTGKYIC